MSSVETKDWSANTEIIRFCLYSALLVIEQLGKLAFHTYCDNGDNVWQRLWSSSPRTHDTHTFIEDQFTYMTILILWLVLGSAFLRVGNFHWHSFSVEALSSGRSVGSLRNVVINSKQWCRYVATCINLSKMKIKKYSI